MDNNFLEAVLKEENIHVEETYINYSGVCKCGNIAGNSSGYCGDCVVSVAEEQLPPGYYRVVAGELFKIED